MVLRKSTVLGCVSKNWKIGLIQFSVETRAMFSDLYGHIRVL